MVHVAGDVARPGVVRISAGARVVDAIEAAGGGLPDADLDRLNLAAKVADGQRIAVAKIGAPDPGRGRADGRTVTATAGEAAGPINVNTATSLQLEELPGIGPSLAGADHRRAREARRVPGGHRAAGRPGDRRAAVRRHQGSGLGVIRFGPVAALAALVVGILDR